MVPVKPRARYLPTLTQIVTAEELMEGPETVPGLPGGAVVIDDDAIFRQVVVSVMPAIELRLKEELQTLVEETMHQLSATLRGEVEAAVRTALAARTVDTGGG